MAKKPATDNPNIQHIKVQGVIFEAPAPYAEGHSLSAVEAKVLNQVLGENLRNNFAKAVKDAKEAAGGDNLSDAVLSDLRAKFAEYADSYEFAQRRAAAPVDPVEKEAVKLARETIRAKLREKKIDASSLPDGRLDEMVEELLAKAPEIRKEAKRRVEATQSVASDTLESLLA